MACSRDVALVLDEDRAPRLEVADDVDVVDDLLADVDRRAVVLERALDGLDGALDAGAVAARGRKEDALDGHRPEGYSAASARGLGQDDADEDDAAAEQLRRRQRLAEPDPRDERGEHDLDHRHDRDARRGQVAGARRGRARRGGSSPGRSSRGRGATPARSATRARPGATPSRRARRTGRATTAGRPPRRAPRRRARGRSARAGRACAVWCSPARKYVASAAGGERGPPRRRRRRAGRPPRPPRRARGPRARARAPPTPGAAPARARRCAPTGRRAPGR